MEFRRIIDDIQQALASDRYLPADTLHSLYSDYVEAVREVNARLRECDDLLQKGHRTEAIHRCEVAPNLLEVVNILDFPEQASWATYLSELNQEPPPALLVDVAAELNQAYALEKPLNDLLRLHRAHALAGSPLRARIEILRKLLERDPNKSFWHEDLQQYEIERHGQIQDELAVCAASHQVLRLAKLDQEVRSPQWRHKPPATLVGDTVRAYADARIYQARVDLKKLGPKLNAAWAALDVSSARVLRQEWEAKAEIGITNDGDPLRDEVTLVFEWLDGVAMAEDEAARHAKSIADLENALETGAPADRLDQLVYELTKFSDREFPQRLIGRVDEQKRVLEAQTRRRLYALLAITCLLISFTAAGIVWYQREAAWKRDLLATVASGAELVQEGKFREAREYSAKVEQERPDFYARPEFQKVVGDLQAAETAEMLAQQNIQQALAGIREQLAENTWPAVEAALNAIAEAYALCRTPDEKLPFKELEREAQRLVREFQEARNEEFRAELRAWTERYAQTPTGDDAQLKERLAEINNLRRKPRVSNELVSQLDPLLTRVQENIRGAQLQQRELLALQAIHQAVGSRIRFQQSLDGYTQQFPQSGRSSHFSKVIKDESGYWAGLESWMTFQSRWSTTHFGRIDRQKAKAFVADAKPLLEQHGAMPFATAARRILPYAEAVLRRVDDNGQRLIDTLDEFLNERVIRDLTVMIKTRDGLRYYSDKPPMLTNGNDWSFQYFNDATATTLARKTLSPDMIANERNPRFPDEYNWESPQSRFRSVAIAKLASLNDTNWESTFHQLIQSLLKESDLDAVLKFVILERLLSLACDGSHSMAEGYKDQLARLTAAGVDPNANWVAPGVDDGNKVRRIANETFNVRLALTAASDRASELFQSLDRPLTSSTYEWVGWLHRDANQKWQISVPRRLSTPAPQALVMLVPGEATGTVVMSRIGTSAGEEIRLEITDTDACREGRPVYLERPVAGNAP